MTASIKKSQISSIAGEILMLGYPAIMLGTASSLSRNCLDRKKIEAQGIVYRGIGRGR